MTTKKKHISLLKKQITKLSQEPFDLEAWKSASIIFLERIFGRNNQKIHQIEEIKIDFSSWSLRDASGSISHLQSCKRRGKEVLEAAIMEIEEFGVDKDEVTDGKSRNKVILAVLENKLSAGRFKDLTIALSGETDKISQQKAINERLKLYGTQLVTAVLAAIIVDSEVLQD